MWVIDWKKEKKKRKVKGNKLLSIYSAYFIVLCHTAKMPLSALHIYWEEN